MYDLIKTTYWLCQNHPIYPRNNENIISVTFPIGNFGSLITFSFTVSIFPLVR